MDTRGSCFGGGENVFPLNNYWTNLLLYRGLYSHARVISSNLFGTMHFFSTVLYVLFHEVVEVKWGHSFHPVMLSVYSFLDRYSSQVQYETMSAVAYMLLNEGYANE